MFNRTIPTLLIISSALVSCKPPGTSKVKTLENFALGKDVRINACAAPEDQLEAKDPRNKVAVFIDVKDAKLAKQLSSELILALSAVPDAAFRIFQAKNGKVLVTPDVANLCNVGGLLKFDGVSPVASSCIIHTPFGTTSGKFDQAMEGSTLVVAPDARAIRHGIVRSMGYMVADALDVDPGFSLLRVELTKAFLTDMTTSSIFTLKAHERLLGSEIDSIVRKNLANNVSNPLEGANTTSDKVYNFMQLVIGEAFDSYYCRTGGTALFPQDVAEKIKEPKDAPLFAYLTDTRLVMSYFFPRTYSTFRLLEAHMEGFAAQFPAPQFRNGAKKSSSGGGFQLAEGGDGESAFALAGDGGQTVGSRAAELEQMIRQNAALTRDTYDQWQQKKSAHDGAWTDVWGTKKSEMDAARSSYRFAQGREQALIQELQRVRDEEKRLGAGARTSSDRQFNVPDLKVGTFDFNAELAKGVQATAKRYGENSSAVLGRAGKFVGGDVGEGFGKGLGDGVGGVLGSFGKITTDSIAATGQSFTDTQKFATDLAVDPVGTMKQKGREYVDGTVKRLESAQQFGRELATWDTRALATRADQTLSGTFAVGTLYNTGKNAYSFFNAKNREEENAAIQAQFDTAGRAISDVQGALVSKAKSAITDSKFVTDAKKTIAGAPVIKPTLATIENIREAPLRVTGMAMAPLMPGSSGASRVVAAQNVLRTASNSYKTADTLIGVAAGEGFSGPMRSMLDKYLPSDKRTVTTAKPKLGPADGVFFKDTSPVTSSGYAYSPASMVPSISSYNGKGALVPYKPTTTTTVGTPSSAYKPTSTTTMGPSISGYKPYSSIISTPSSSSYSASTFSTPITSWKPPTGYSTSGSYSGSGSSYGAPSRTSSQGTTTTRTVSPSSR